MEVIIRNTDKSNYYSTECLTREAFWNVYKPGCDEHLVLHQIRESTSYIPQLDFIAIDNDEITGHIISSKARIIDKPGKEHEVLCVGPFAVLPQFQNKGIGTTLLRYSISEAKRLGFKGMILFGNPGYYHRFGFRNAKEYEITTKDNLNFEPFMALELRENGLDDANGRFIEGEGFTIREDELTEFEKKFPEKEKGRPKVDITIL